MSQEAPQPQHETASDYLAASIAEGVLTVIERYHQRWEGYSLGILPGDYTQPKKPSDEPRGDVKSIALQPGEAVTVAKPTDVFPLFYRQRIIHNENGVANNYRASFLRKWRLERQGVEFRSI